VAGHLVITHRVGLGVCTWSPDQSASAARSSRLCRYGLRLVRILAFRGALRRSLVRTSKERGEQSFLKCGGDWVCSPPGGQSSTLVSVVLPGSGKPPSSAQSLPIRARDARPPLHLAASPALIDFKHAQAAAAFDCEDSGSAALAGAGSPSHSPRACSLWGHRRPPIARH
jgi:hypothetical protein